jgi:hypothetical protein
MGDHRPAPTIHRTAWISTTSSPDTWAGTGSSGEQRCLQSSRSINRAPACPINIPAALAVRHASLAMPVGFTH